MREVQTELFAPRRGLHGIHPTPRPTPHDETHPRSTLSERRGANIVQPYTTSLPRRGPPRACPPRHGPPACPPGVPPRACPPQRRRPPRPPILSLHRAPVPATPAMVGMIGLGAGARTLPRLISTIGTLTAHTTHAHAVHTHIYRALLDAYASHADTARPNCAAVRHPPPRLEPFMHTRPCQRAHMLS